MTTSLALAIGGAICITAGVIFFIGASRHPDRWEPLSAQGTAALAAGYGLLQAAKSYKKEENNGDKSKTKEDDRSQEEK
jgi:hypothetical protein